jgi:NTP pyrophosphatase (non-canonical NTP hydrolase)
MTDHFNGLTPGEAERLALFIEECGEAIQAACKVLRHGYQSFDPTARYIDRITNRGALEQEMGDVRAAMILLCRNDINKAGVHIRADEKLESVKQWLHHQDFANSGRSEVMAAV